MTGKEQVEALKRVKNPWPQRRVGELSPESRHDVWKAGYLVGFEEGKKAADEASRSRRP